MLNIPRSLTTLLPLTINIILCITCHAEYSATLYHIQNNLNNHTPNKSAVLTSIKPIPSASEQAWFSDIRVKLDLSETSNQHEINLGLSTRKETTFLGTGEFGYYAFWDISHIKNQVYAQQTTLGLEWLNQQSHLAANLYVPQASFTTQIDLANQIDMPEILAQTQQEGLLQKLHY